MKAVKAKLNLFRAVEEILTVGGFPIEIKYNIDIIIGNPPGCSTSRVREHRPISNESYRNSRFYGVVKNIGVVKM